MALKYTAKVWMTSVLLTPFLITICTLIMDGFMGIGDFFGMVLIIAIIGFIASIPNFILLLIFTNKILHLFPAKNIKLLISIAAFLLTYFLFSFLRWYLDDTFEVGLITLAYSFTLTLGIWYFTLNPKETKDMQLNTKN